MQQPFAELGVMFIAGFGPITRDASQSKTFYLDTLGLPLKAMEHNEDYLLTDPDGLDGVKHFALWPLAQAAQSCFGQDQWPKDLPIPQSWLEFEVADVTLATEVLITKGYHLLKANVEEPWGQTVTRLLSPEGILVGVVMTPWLRG